MNPLRDPVLWIIAGIFVFALVLHAAFAEGTPLGAVVPGCVPAYWTLDVEHNATWAFSVEHIAKGRLWRNEYVFPNRPCCELSRRIVTEVVQRVRDPKTQVRVDETCR